MLKYSIRLDEDRLPMLVQEDSFSYEGAARAVHDNHELVSFLNEKEHVMDLPEEHCYIVALNNKCGVIGYFEISIGTYNASMIEPKAIFTRLLAVGAVKFILVHNHPSGDPEPSKADLATAQKLISGGKLLDIDLLDSIVIGYNRWISFREEGLL